MSKTLWEYFKVINNYCLFHEADRLFFCLDKEWNSNKYVGRNYLCCIMDGQEALAEPVSVSKKLLLASLIQTYDEPAIYYFCPLYFQTRLYGYTSLAYKYAERFRYQIRSWHQIVSNALEFLRLKNDIHYLTLCQQTSSLQDALTGFIKLQELQHQLTDNPTSANWLLAVNIAFPSVKEHFYDSNYQNDIISAVALAIKQTCTNHETCCRAADNTFLIACNKQKDTISEKLNVLLHRTVHTKYCENPPNITCQTSTDCSVEGTETLLRTPETATVPATLIRPNRDNLSQYNSILELRRELMSHPQNAPDIDTASRKLCISKGYFRAIYKRCFGVSYVQDCINEKIMLAKYLLCTTVMSVYSVALQCGYTDEKYFAGQFHQNVGCSLMQYRKQYCEQ